MFRGVVAHGGAGSPSRYSDGAEAAAEAGFSVLQHADATAAVVEAVRILEDDERFNAGTGAVLRFDGKAHMDAAVMNSQEQCGAVADITGVRNPVLVARKVMESPHILFVCEGAVEFARKHGFQEYDNTTPRTRKRLQDSMAEFVAGKRPKWPANWATYHDTVGAVAADGTGGFAAAGSTGGTFPALNGRVGDIPLIGCGIYAGKLGAVVATGIGEEIIRKVLAKTVYDYIASGMSAQQAVEKGIGLYDRSVSIGLIAVDSNGFGVASTTDMAWGMKS